MIRAHIISPGETSFHENSANSTLKSYVKRVSDHYKSSSDWEILKIIRSALQGNAFLNANNILVKVEEGWVYLEGSVENEDQRNLAKKLIRDIFGVFRVTNYLTFPRHGG